MISKILKNNVGLKSFVIEVELNGKTNQLVLGKGGSLRLDFSNEESLAKFTEKYKEKLTTPSKRPQFQLLEVEDTSEIISKKSK